MDANEVSIQVTYLREWVVRLPEGLTDEQRDDLLTTLGESMKNRNDLPLEVVSVDVIDSNDESIFSAES